MELCYPLQSMAFYYPLQSMARVAPVSWERILAAEAQYLMDWGMLTKMLGLTTQLVDQQNFDLRQGINQEGRLEPYSNSNWKNL